MRVAALLGTALLAGCGGWDAGPTETAGITPAQVQPLCPAPEALPAFETSHPVGLHTDGNRIVDGDGNVVTLRGVNRSGSEYRCIQGFGFFDGPDDDESIAAMAAWGINAVRVPLNEQCWLGVEGAPEQYSGCNYVNAIRNYVNRLHAHRLIPILDLHWAAPMGTRAVRLQPMPNRDYTAAFWQDVARTFADDDVILEPYNEPFPASNSDGLTAFKCWLDGCEEDAAIGMGEMHHSYYGLGMQALLDAIRDTGSEHLVLAGGVQYANALGGWLEYPLFDRADNLALAWHVYNYNKCNSVECWDDVPKALAQSYPIVATEFGTDDCSGETIQPFLEWMDENGSGYLAWSWNAFGPCRAKGSMVRGSPYSLITDYASGTPNDGYARAFYDHLQTKR